VQCAKVPFLFNTQRCACLCRKRFVHISTLSTKMGDYFQHVQPLERRGVKNEVKVKKKEKEEEEKENNKQKNKKRRHSATSNTKKYKKQRKSRRILQNKG